MKKTLRTLIVENNAVDSKIVIGMLNKSANGVFNMESVDTLQKAFELLTYHKYDVVLLDLNLNDSRGLETLQKMHEKFPKLPIVVHTGVYQEEIGLKAITMGAQDYLNKGHYLAYGLIKSLFYAVERKKAEQELQNAYYRLKETQSQLIQAEKMNIIGAVASGIAHEVKNPLATILYGIEFLKTKLSIGDVKMDLALKSINEAANKANNIIKDLLDFSSLSDIKLENENINLIIEQALKLINHQCDKYCIKIIKKFGKDLIPVRVNKNRIEQVLVNLMLNGINAMHQGGQLTIITSYQKFYSEDLGWVDRRNRKINDGEDVVIVDIDDTGHGIEEENISKIFDPFFTTRRGSGGVGLGLSIAKTIMNNHNGMIMLFNRRDHSGARARLVFKVS